MSRALVVGAHTESDILDAYVWYEARQEGLGRWFVGQLESAFARILTDPFSYPEDLPGIRRSLLHVFPYLVFYTLDEETIEILAVIHASQDRRNVEPRLDA